MRFATAAVILATSVAAHDYAAPEVSTAYTTALVTITSCPDSVPDCPARSKTTSVSVTSIPVISTTAITPVAPPQVTSPPHHNNSTIVVPPVSSAKPEEPTPEEPKPEEPKPEEPKPEEPVCPGSSVVAVTKSYTTVLTSVEYSTIEVPCTTEAPPPTETQPPVTVVPPPAGNTTVPPIASVTPPTAGAASLAGSAVFAAVAGLLAFTLA